MVIELPKKAGEVPDLKQRDVRETTSQSALLSNKTSYMAIAATDFFPNDSTKAWTKGGDFVPGESLNAYAPVNLPHGAVVTACIVYGDATDTNWILYRAAISDGTSLTVMAQAVFDTEDTTISSPIIDNQNYSYFIGMDQIDVNELVEGARITYTTDYD